MADQLASRTAVRVLQWAVRLYPPEKRAWGEAIVAEADSAAEVGAALSWMIGGLMVAFRAFFSRLFQRPAGKNDPVLVGSAQIPPPIPWKLAFVCLVVSGSLMFVPDLRQALGVTYSSWTSEFIPRDETAMWEKIAREAESKGDAPAMAFAAMRLPSPAGERFDEAVHLAEEAVGKDASLTWTYYFLAQTRGDSRFHGSPHPELTERLQEWDPKNAVPYLAEADAMVHNHEGDPRWRGLQGFSFDAPVTTEDIARIGGRDPQWRQLMDQAFAAPVYDAYFARRLNLDLQVMQRLGLIDPQRAFGAYLYGWWSPLGNLREYAVLRFARGEEAEHAGQWENAAGEYWSVAQFGQRLRLGAQWDGETWSAVRLQEASFKHLQPVLLKLGRAQEAQAVAYAAQLEHSENDETRARSRSEGQRLFTFSLASGVFVHFCALVFDASLLLMAILLVTFALKGAPRFVRFGLTYVPLLLVTACTGLLCTYHPYAEYYRSYLANPTLQDRESVFNALMVTGVPRYITYWGLIARSPIYLWCALIATLGAVCIWLLSRALRHRHV